MDFTQLTTDGLIEHVKADPTATERELEMLSRLLAAIELVEDLAHQVTRLEAAEAAGGTDT